MKKKIIVILAIFVVIGIGLYAYIYKAQRDISSESTAYSLRVKDLQRQFSEEAVKANKKYDDKTIEVSGKITSIDAASHSVVIDDKLSAVFKDSTLKFSANESVKIKGRFVGYDDLLEEFKMDQVSLAK